VDGHARKYEFEPTDLVCLVHDTVEAFNRSLGRAEDIAVDEQGDRPVVNADAVALEQALVNLLDNALKYSTADRRVVVRVGVDGAHATVAVIDHGIGISRRDRRRIFEKFYRGAGAAHSRDGFGVGLAIVAELVKAHRGSVGVTSAPGQGSTFTIRLPLLARGGVAAGARVLDQGIAESTEEAGWNRAHNGATRRRAS
jgi:signal transduction histidine kinase